MSTLKLFDPGVGLNMFLKIAYLIESRSATFNRTLIRFFSSVNPLVIVEFADTLNHFVAPLPFLFVLTFEQPILSFQIFLDKIKDEAR